VTEITRLEDPTLVFFRIQPANTISLAPWWQKLS